MVKFFQGYRTQICATLIGVNHVLEYLGIMPAGLGGIADGILIPIGGAFFAAKIQRLNALLSGQKPV